MTQQRRVVVAIAYAGLFVGLNFFLFGSVVPPFGPEGVWFYSGLAILLLATALQEPFHTTPAQCIGNALALVLVVIAFSGFSPLPSAYPSGSLGAGRVALLLYAGLLAAVGLVAIAFKDSVRMQRYSKVATGVCATFGSGRVVFSVVYLLSVTAVYANRPNAMVVLYAAWLVVVVVRPLEWIAVRWPFSAGSDSERVATVVGIRYPGLVDLRVDSGLALEPGVGLRDQSGVGYVVLDATRQLQSGWALAAIEGSSLPEVGCALALDTSSDRDHSVIGPVDVGTSVGQAVLRAPIRTAKIEDGSLVQIPIRGVKTLYQVVSAEIRQETFERGVVLRYVEITAQKIGSWSDESRRFQPVSWMPDAGQLAKLLEPRRRVLDASSVGFLPGTDYGVALDVDALVTRNTAVLGILGVGKTYLAFELIRRVVAEGVRAVVLDITGEYGQHFAGLVSQEDQSALYGRVDSATSAYHEVYTRSQPEGCSQGRFVDAVGKELEAFLGSEQPLLILNPSRFTAFKQTSGMYEGRASRAALTVAEVTRVISEGLLNLLQSLPHSGQARVLLVLEEAHSLVPEWNSTAHDADKQATSGTSKAVLQGRKHGLGVLLITQRTANVTKTILNQCHTVFAMRSFDATGQEFLRNYVGEEYSAALGSLADRHAVLFGTASSCPTPVVIEVNDHDRMLADFWVQAKGDLAFEPLGIPDSAE